MTLVWGGTPKNDNACQHFVPTSETPMTNEQFTALSGWWSTSGKATAAMLAGNLVKRFNLEKGKAWILAVRFINEKRG